MPLSLFITGGTTGIGWAVAKLYLEEGHRVGVCGRNLEKLPEESKSYPSLSSYEVDVTDPLALKKAIEDFSKDGLDIMFANAGRSHGSKTRRPDFEVSRDIINININGVLNAFGPAVEIFEKQGHGQLVATASVAGYVGLPGASAYSASKAAIIKLCESYNLDFKNIQTTCICPGFIDTPLTQKNDHSMPWLMSLDKGAQIIKKAIEQKKAIKTFPWQMRFVVTFLKIIPRACYRFIMGLPVANYSK